MKARKLIAAVLSVILVLLSFAACQSADTQPTEADASDSDSIYRLENYESREFFNIKKIDLNESLAVKCTSYKFTYLSDDLWVKGYISVPAEAAISQKPCKCLLFNRGGNRDFGKLEDDETAKLCSVCGRIVIASQYRGADGSDGDDRFGGDDLHDVIKLIDLCENHFSFVDMEDFCVAGASRGGMMTYLTARQDSRVKRIIAISAASDLFELYDCRDDMKEVMNDTIGCTPEEDPSEYEKRSAVYWADEIDIPVLIIHSKQDELVPFDQAEAMYEKLKDHTDCTFITYEDDVHGPHPEDAVKIRDWLNDQQSAAAE